MIRMICKLNIIESLSKITMQVSPKATGQQQISQEKERMLFASSRNTIAQKVPIKTAQRIGKIKELLSRALGEVHEEELRLKKSASNSPSKRKSEESSQSESVSEVLANLKKGYLMVKHSEKNLEPHSKFVYLSQDCRNICWKSMQRADQKSIELSSISRVVKEGAQFYLKASRIRDINRCVVVIADQRRLQLEANSQIEAEYFRYQLQRAIKNSKSMKLNYKYWKNQ